MDQDGANVRFLTRGSDLVLTPRFSPTTQEITYMSFGQRRAAGLSAQHRNQPARGGRRFPNMSFSPRFSPDGQRVIMSLQEGGNSDLFVLDLRSKQKTQLTTAGDRHRAVLFAGRHAHLLRKRSRRLPADLRHELRTAGRPSASASARATTRRRCGRRAATSSPSPSSAGGNFAIGIMKPDGSGERILTEGFHNEGPTFAPNGRVLMFFRDPGGNSGPSLYTVDITGRNEQRVQTPGFASDPAWSPLLTST